MPRRGGQRKTDVAAARRLILRKIGPGGQARFRGNRKRGPVEAAEFKIHMCRSPFFTRICTVDQEATVQ